MRPSRSNVRAWCAAAVVAWAALAQAGDAPAIAPPPGDVSLEEQLAALRDRVVELEKNSARRNSAGTARVTTEASDAAADDPTAGERTEPRQPYGSSADKRSGGTEGGDSDPERRLAALQQKWDKLDLSQKEAKDAAKAKPTYKIGGRLQLDFLSFPGASEGIGFFEHPDPADPRYGTDPEDRFFIRRLWLEGQGEIPDLMLWRLQIDFSTPQDPAIRDAYLGWRLPYHQTLLVGNQKRPLGLDNLYSSRFDTFMERPLVEDTFNPGLRRLGAAMYGYSDDLLFNWRYGVFELQDIAQPGRYVGDSLQLGAYGRLASTPWYDETSNGRGYLHLGVVGAAARPDGDAGPSDSNANQARFAAAGEARTDTRWLDTGAIRGATAFEHAGVESVLNVGAVQLQGEYLTAWVQRDATTKGTGPDVFFHGGWVSASYFLTGEHIPWDRTAGVIDRVKPFENFFLVDRCTGGVGRGWGAWQVAGRLEYIDLTDADIRGRVGANATLGLNWYWNAYSRVMVNVTRGEVGQHRNVGGFTSGDYWVFGTRVMADF